MKLSIVVPSTSSVSLTGLRFILTCSGVSMYDYLLTRRLWQFSLQPSNHTHSPPCDHPRHSPNTSMLNSVWQLPRLLELNRSEWNLKTTSTTEFMAHPSVSEIKECCLQVGHVIHELKVIPYSSHQFGERLRGRITLFVLAEWLRCVRYRVILRMVT